ncbi:MAG: tetratricopeptide repeat protein, partial [Myxococcales bacterium]|nr:tetratricopeptide repeat protein [Myxococcales bacterium]
EDTEIVAGLTKKLDEREANPGKSSGRGWVLATVAIVGVIGVAGGAWYMAPTLLGTVAHSEDTVESTPVPAAGEVGSVPTPTPSEPTPTTGTTTQAGLAAPPSGSEPPAAAPPAAEPPAPTVPEAPAPTVAEAPAPPAPTPPAPTPPAPSAATPPTPTPPAAVNTAGLPSDPAEASAALVTRAEQQAGAGDRAGAEASLRRALTLDDENYEAMAKLAEVLVASGQHEEALSLAQTAVRRRARVGRYHLIYGDVRAAMGDRSGASRSWSRAVDVDESLAAEAARRRSN